MSQYKIGAKSGYFKMKSQSERKLVYTSDYSLRAHVNEGNTVSDDGTNRVLYTLLPAVPGRTHTVLVNGACKTRVRAASGEQIVTPACTDMACGTKLTSPISGARMDLECYEKGIWTVVNETACFIVSTP